MRILCVSDAVVPELQSPADTRQFGRIDLLLSCGDLPPEYLSHLARIFDAPLYYIRGNHDIRYDQSPPRGCVDIHGRVVRHGSLKLLGLEGSRWYNGGPFQYTEKQMAMMVWRLRPSLWWSRGVDILLTHAPPRHIHDAEDLCHRGFSIYRKVIDWYAPRYHLHGHIHSFFQSDAHRTTREQSTRVVNCYGYYRFDIDEDPISEKTKKRPGRRI
jgi:hypothetical protein